MPPPPCRPLRLGGTIVPEAIDWEGGPPLLFYGLPPYYFMAYLFYGWPPYNSNGRSGTEYKKEGRAERCECPTILKGRIRPEAPTPTIFKGKGKGQIQVQSSLCIRHSMSSSCMQASSLCMHNHSIVCHSIE
jgi:hypothetical protein